MYFADVGDRKTAVAVCIGIALGLLYTFRRGSLPASVYRLSESHWAGGASITTDDDPRNISPKIYLPILAAMILLAAIMYYWVMHARR